MQSGQPRSALIQLPARHEYCPGEHTELPLGFECAFMLYQSEDILSNNIRVLERVAAPLQCRCLKQQFSLPSQAGNQTLFEYPGLTVMALQNFSDHYIRQRQKSRNGDLQLHPQISARVQQLGLLLFRIQAACTFGPPDSAQGADN
ncbi:hypothetical protein D3C75_519640 [compost metagenome]